MPQSKQKVKVPPLFNLEKIVKDKLINNNVNNNLKVPKK
jgi:hypothetical protein